jgi:hypothetical protein
MNEAFFILWLSVGLLFLIRVFLLKKINTILINKNIDLNLYKTSVIIGNIPKIPTQNNNAQLFKRIYNNLTIILYVFVFVNFILLAIEKI